MRNNNVLGLVFSNMHDDCLPELTGVRAMGSVPFGGRYRLIDFVLSNMVNSGISKVGVVTKNKYQSLLDHISSGQAWDLSRKNEGLFFLPPYGGDDTQYAGRLFSLSTIERFLRTSREDYVLMSDCHMVANIDYAPLVRRHIESGADITVAYCSGTAPAEIDNLLLSVDADGALTDIRIQAGGEGLYGIGLYVVTKEKLLRYVQDALSRHLTNFERDVIQRLAGTIRLYGYAVPEKVIPITSLAGYYSANMSLLDRAARQQLFRPDRAIYTKVRDCAPALYGLHADARGSLVADGAVIDGKVRNSIVFRDVKIGRDTVVENCILMQGTVIMPHTRIGCVICDKNAVIREDIKLQGAASYPIMIKKGSVV